MGLPKAWVERHSCGRTCMVPNTNANEEEESKRNFCHEYDVIKITSFRSTYRKLTVTRLRASTIWYYDTVHLLAASTEPAGTQSNKHRSLLLSIEAIVL